MYNMYRDGTEKLIGRYCGMTAPGPLDSTRGAVGIKILLHSDQEGVYSGFKARYSFEVAKSIYGGTLINHWYVVNMKICWTEFKQPKNTYITYADYFTEQI